MGFQKQDAMALRAFHANPSIGGFGGESTSDILLLHPCNKESEIANTIAHSGDAICQIVKELVDNAIDACQGGDQNKKQRVKVEVVPCRSNDSILQVTISDNGCGMENIQESYGIKFTKAPLLEKITYDLSGIKGYNFTETK